jgi:hypothetical protein
LWRRTLDILLAAGLAHARGRGHAGRL